MTEQTARAGVFTEAPASWNTRYISKQGFECQLTLRADDPMQLLKLANEIMAKMVEAGIQPAVGNGHASNGETAQGDNPAWCAIHGCEMKRHEKDGKVWYSHKVGDKWCRGK